MDYVYDNLLDLVGIAKTGHAGGDSAPMRTAWNIYFTQVLCPKCFYIENLSSHNIFIRMIPRYEHDPIVKTHDGKVEVKVGSTGLSGQLTNHREYDPLLRNNNARIDYDDYDGFLEAPKPGVRCRRAFPLENKEVTLIITKKNVNGSECSIRRTLDTRYIAFYVKDSQFKSEEGLCSESDRGIRNLPAPTERFSGMDPVEHESWQVNDPPSSPSYIDDTYKRLANVMSPPSSPKHMPPDPCPYEIPISYEYPENC